MAGLFGFRRGDLPEPPPKGWELLGVHPAYTVEEHPKADIDRLCRALGVSAADAYAKGRKLGACVSPSEKRVILPLGVDPEKRAALVAHEGGAHTWDLRHPPSGHGWIGPDGQPAQELSPAQAMLKRSMAEAQLRQQAQTEPPRGLLALGAAR